MVVRINEVRVAPPVGAWIETSVLAFAPLPALSHPPWVRGLKRHVDIFHKNRTRRTPRGCVD